MVERAEGLLYGHMKKGSVAAFVGQHARPRLRVVSAPGGDLPQVALANDGIGARSRPRPRRRGAAPGTARRPSSPARAMRCRRSAPTP
jgi:hypothetical protein